MERLKLLIAGLLLVFSPLAAGTTIELDVNGLVCGFCAQGIEKTLKKNPSTEAVFVSLEHRLVAVQLKEGADIEDGALREALKDSGYTVVGIRRTQRTLDDIRREAKNDD